MKKNLLCAAFGMAALLGTSGAAQAQAPNRWCSTDEHNAELARTFHDPLLAAERAAADALAERLQRDDVFARQFYARQAAGAGGPVSQSPPASRIVPVVVHIITKCGAQTLTEAQVQLGIDKVNADFSFTNADAPTTVPVFMPYTANMDIEFRLAKLDPQGNPFSGIHRVTSLATDGIDPRDQIKTIVPSWDGYFNFWLVDAISPGPGSIPGGTILGYAQFPANGRWSTWGLVMRADDWFTPPPISDGRTATHELGHCFNLYHTFQGGCGSTCATTGDLVCDTPPTPSPTYNCNRTQNLCSNDVGAGSPFTTDVADQIQNHMSYDACHTMFSLGQKVRVDAAFATFSYIRNLISPANLTRTGVATGQVVPPPSAVAYLNTCQLSLQGSELVVCQGRPTTFTDASYGAPITGVSWTFANGTPATSTAPNPTVTFNTPGVQAVTLTPAGAAAPLTVNVRVLPTGQRVAPVVEGFEGRQQFTDGTWRVETSATSGATRWKQVTLTGGNVTTEGDSAVRVANGSAAAATVNTLYSPAFDTRNLASNTPTPTLTFDMAYAKRTGTSADELKVSFSADCGRSWQMKRTYTTTLPTVTTLQANFTPTSLTQWRTESINLTGQYLNLSSMMIRFESTAAANGNNLYLDNIRLNGRPLGVGLAAELAAAGVALAPNPLTSETGLSFSLTRATRVAVRVTDVLGRTVLTDAARTLAPGDYQRPLAARLQRAAPGVYVVTVELDGRAYSQKLLIQ